MLGYKLQNKPPVLLCMICTNYKRILSFLYSMTAPYKTYKVVIMVFNSWGNEGYYRGVKMTYLGCSGTPLNALNNRLNTLNLFLC